MVKPDDVLKRFESLQGNEKQQKDDPEKEHTLQENAKNRALNPTTLNAGTPFDWEDLEAYQKELERLDREGVGRKKTDH